jgi:glycosyltransferase involved in cell wall biosynthesis
MRDLVSVVIPTYNYARFVGEAVESALGQTYRNIEVIVVDDGSTDHTQDVLRRFGGAIASIRKQNQGLSAARNTGIMHARGAYVAFLDSDDIWLPEKIALQMDAFGGDCSVGLVTCGGLLMREDGEIYGSYSREPVAGRARLLEKLVMENFVAGGSDACIRRVCFDAVGLFDESLRSAEDWDMWLRITRRYGVRFLTQPLCKVRVSSKSMSSASNNATMISNELAVLDKYFGDVGESCSVLAKRTAYARRYLCGARASLAVNDIHQAREYIAKGLRWNPWYLLATPSGAPVSWRALTGFDAVAAMRSMLRKLHRQ